MAWETDPMKDTKGYLTQEQLFTFLETALAMNESWYVLLLTLAHTGRRVSEVVKGNHGYGFKVKDIDFESNNITYNILKKNPRKTEEIQAGVPRSEPIVKAIPTSAFLLIVLKKYIQNQGLKENDYLFPFSKQWAGQIVKKVGEAAGITKVGDHAIGPHKFRHTFAVILTQQKISNPEDLKTLQDLLQHSKIEMTMNYLRYGNTRARELVNEFPTGIPKN